MPHSLRVVFVGDNKSGKTSLLMAKDHSDPPSIAISRIVTYKGEEFKLNLFEVQNSEAYVTYKIGSYANSDLFVCTFSIGHPESLATAESKRIPELRSYQPNVPIILLGLKSDLRDDEEQLEKLSRLQQKPITHAQGARLAQKMGCITYHECSNKTN